MPADRLHSLPARIDALLDHAVDRLLACGGGHGELRVAAPLGLGKSHRILNALYARIAADPSRPMTLMTALSLTPPSPASDLERRFLQPFLDRHFGEDFPALDYAIAQRNGTLPAHVAIEEFYLQSGGLLGKPDAQRRYNSLNYTHVARAVAKRVPHAIVHLVAASPDGSQLSLSCNPDLTLDLLDHIERLGGARPLLLAEVHPDLPFLGGAALVARGFFDIVLEPAVPAPRLFALPRQPVADAEFAIGLYASTLVRDGGTLQIGIGALSDALTHALLLRHTRNADYRALLRALWPEVETSALVRDEGGLDPFVLGLYGASEMLMDGFAHLVDAGIVKRRVVDDIGVMRRANAGATTAEDDALLARDGQFLHGGFFLGSHDFYAWLRGLPPDTARAIGMTRISHINELYGLNQELEALQRRDARFFNTCMMATALGAAVSDALDDGQVVSGVGGQYNFVAMAHALDDARSVLMLRATRTSGGTLRSNIVWNYGHTTIPRHLRDICITEYGIADLRGMCDEDCIAAMLRIADSACAPGLRAQALQAGKLATDTPTPTPGRNTAAALRATLAPFRAAGLLPDYPLGSDFTPVEQHLARALGWLKRNTATRGGMLSTLWAALRASSRDADDEAMRRMALDRPTGWREHLSAGLVRLALARTRDRARS
ncbi:acetyl-CoA hydrolase/transferase C-terminal domain-containing protein [Chiayiivirga flava]|uniref:Acyl-CoA hydrolase n=1 Tax=Chiayiivirga flava TaxID=659595 RepID=A0A7W8D7E7_9GAMM|nr:acetyl-CoA hydrolase/transferase C-terminal domain-containing protein [Chiayiivirga flava]MBB5209294.1 acyl-CoA hydrolase [Chiayiivirga flava]